MKIKSERLSRTDILSKNLLPVDLCSQKFTTVMSRYLIQCLILLTHIFRSKLYFEKKQYCRCKVYKPFQTIFSKPQMPPASP